MKKIILFFLIFTLLLTSGFAYAWKLPLEVSTVSDDGEKVYNKLVVGIESGATDGFDNLWDTPALFSNSDPSSPVSLRAYLKNESAANKDLYRLWKDIRGTTLNEGNTTWDITVDSVPAGKSVVLSWEIHPGVINKGERLVLKDNNSLGTDNRPVELDITQTTSYTFVAAEGETRSLSLTLSEPKSDNHSGSSSGFGCGTIKLHNNDSDSGWSRAIGILVLCLPVVLIRFIRLTRLRLSIIIR